MCFTISNWESWFLKLFSESVTLRLHRCYLHCFNERGALIPSSRKKKDVYAGDAMASQPLCTLFPGL